MSPKRGASGSGDNDQEMKDFEAASAGSEEQLSGYLEGLGIPVDKDGNPTKKPPLPKNWRSMPRDSVERKAFRMWYTNYGPEKVGAEKKGFKNKVAQARNKAIARRNKRKADKAERDKAVASKK